MEDQPQPDHPFDEKTETFSRTIVQPTETYDHDDSQPISNGAMVIGGDHAQKFPNHQQLITDNSEQSAPSIGCVVHDRDKSQTEGSDFMSIDTPPSRNDLACRDPSQPGYRFSGGQNLPEGNDEEVNSEFKAISSHTSSHLPAFSSTMLNFKSILEFSFGEKRR